MYHFKMLLNFKVIKEFDLIVVIYIVNLLSLTILKHIEYYFKMLNIQIKLMQAKIYLLN